MSIVVVVSLVVVAVLTVVAHNQTKAGAPESTLRPLRLGRYVCGVAVFTVIAIDRDGPLRWINAALALATVGLTAQELRQGRRTS